MTTAAPSEASACRRFVLWPSEAPRLSEFKPTEYWEAVQKFQKFIVAEARNNGLSPERLGEAAHVALSTAKPKARYAVIPQRFKNWTRRTKERIAALLAA
jgi:hypothetical protein